MTESSDISTIFAPTPGEETQVFFRSEDTTPAGDTTRQAQTAALAELTSAPEDVDFFELYRSRYQLLDRQLRAGMAKNIYEKNRAERLRNAVSMAPFIQQDTNFYAQSSAIIADLLEQERSESQPTQKNATQNVFALQNLDPEEARLLERAYQLPNFLEQRIETDARMAMLQEVVARETAMRGDAPLLKTILDYALFMLPFQNSIGATGNVETDRVTNDFYSNVISGGAQFQETAAFWQMSPDEFTEEFLVDTLNNFKQSATILGYNNRVLETALIGELMMGVDPTFKSALDVIDNGPLFLFGALKAGKALGLVKTLARSGSRSSSAETLSRLLSVVENEGETALRKTTGETVDDVIDSTLPSVVNPDLGSSVINVGAEATRRYDTGRQLIDVLEIQRPLLSRLSRDELSAAIEAQLKNIRGQFGDKRVLNVSTRTRTDSSGIKSPVLVVEMGTAKGGRFANLNNLTRFLRGQGYDPQYVNKIGEDIPRAPRKPRDPAKPAPRKRAAKPLPPEKDPVIDIFLRNVNVGDAVSVSGYKVNPSKETLDRLVANSQFGEVKILVTKEGNKISLPDGMTHSEAIDELKILSSDVGRSSYFLKKGETKPLTFKDTPFKTRMEEGVKPASKIDQDLELLSGKITKAEKDLEEVKQSYALVADLSGKVRLDTTRNLRQQERALKKDIRRFKDQRADLEASRTQADPVKADISPAPEGTGWTAEIEFPIEEAGFYAPITDVKSNWGIGRFVLGGRQLSSEDLFGLAVMSASRRNSLISTINKNIVPLFRALKKREQRALSDIIQVGERQGKWLTRREIDVMYNDRFNLTDGVTPKRFYDAYSAYKALNDLEYTLRNDELFSLMNAKGFQTVSIEIPEGFFMSARNAKVERSLPARLPEGRTYNATKGFHYLDDDLRRYNPKELEEQGYVLVKLEGTMAMPYQAGDIHISNVLVRKSEVSIRPLANVQIPYRPGGHRMYSTKVRHFAKQASVMRQADTGEKFLGAAKTWKGATNKADLEDWVERHNLGIKIMREYRSAERTEEEAREALSDLVDNADDFWNDVEDGYITLDELFEVVGDRELPSAYARSPNAIVGDSGEGVPGYLSQVQTQGRMYYSPKGKPLTDPQGEELPTLDAFETVNRALGSVSNLIGFSTYKQRAMGKWVKTYGDYLDVAGKKSLSRQFVEGRFRRDTPATIVNAAEQQRQTIMRTLNWTSPEQMNAKSLTRNLVEYLESSNIVGTNQAASIVNWLDESDFTSKLRGYIFDAKLGLFNVAQFPMQITTMLAATSIDPKKGMQAMYATPFLRVMNTKYNDMDSFAEAMKGRKFGFDSTEDFIDMATELRRGGFLDVNSSQVQINDMNLSTGFNLTGSIGTDARELGRTFFYEAERWNRTTAWQMAWRRVKERTPNLDRQTFLERVFQEAEDLSLNMSEASSAAYQKGILSIPTQFWAYQNRILEAAFGRQFTVQEKIRLVAGQYILYGSIGIPVLAQASEYLKGKAGETPNLQEKPVQFVMDRGLIDTIISVVTGNDLAFSERAGIGHFHTDVIRELFGAGRYGDASTFEVLGGASASIFSDFAEDTSNLFKWMALEAGAGQPLGPVTRNQVENVFRNISTVNNSLKFYALWKYGTLESSSGTVLFSEGTKSDAIASLFGIPMGEVQDINAKVNWMRNRKKAVEDVAQILIDYRTKFAARYPQTGDIANEMYLFTQVIPDELLFDALERANRFTPDPVYESISRNVREKKAELEASK